MSETQHPRQLGQSIFAVVAGFIFVVILSLGTDEIFHLTGTYPPWGQSMSDALFGLATAYRLIYGLAGSYITAWFAPYQPMKHALIGAAIGTVLSAAGAAGTWDKNLGPHWYPVVLIVTALPLAWLAGKLYETRSAKQAS